MTAEGLPGNIFPKGRKDRLKITDLSVQVQFTEQTSKNNGKITPTSCKHSKWNRDFRKTGKLQHEHFRNNSLRTI